MLAVKRKAICGLMAIALTIGLTPAWAANGAGPIAPGKDVKCPVCGMFVARYPDWVAQVVFSDGSHDHFDGAKDMFKYLFNLDQYKPGKTETDIAAIFVTEYYDMETIDARSAFFVVGSDVYGPMGHELIPFKTREDAEAFLTDHKGRQVLMYPEVTPYVIRRLDP